MAGFRIRAALQKRPVFFAAFAGISLMVFAVASFVRFQDSDSPSSIRSAPGADSYVRNLTWETEFFSTVPYRKEDDLEFAFFADYPGWYSYVFDWNAIFERYSLIALSDGNEIAHEELSRKKYRGESNVFLRLKAKFPGATGNDRFVTPKIVFHSEWTPESDFPNGTPKDSGPSENVATISQTPPQAFGSGTDFFFPVRTFSSDVNNAVSLFWGTENSISRVLIGGKPFEWAYHSGHYVFVVDRASFAAGEYFAAVLTKEGKLVPLKEGIVFESDGQLVGISAITPSSVPNSRESYVTLQGRGFSKIVSVQLSNSLVIHNASFRLINDSVAIVKIPAGISEGSYAMNVMDVSGISSPKNAVVTITK